MFWRWYTFNSWHLFDVMYSFVCTRVLAEQTWFVIRFERASRYRFVVMFLRLHDHFWEARWVSKLQMLWGKHFTFETLTDVLVGEFGPFTVSRTELTWTFGLTKFWDVFLAVLRRAVGSLSFSKFCEVFTKIWAFYAQFLTEGSGFSVQIWKFEEFNKIHAKLWLKKNINE